MSSNCSSLSIFPLERHALTKVKALKNADSMLRKVFQAVDTSGDGRIQYAGKWLISVPFPSSA